MGGEWALRAKQYGKGSVAQRSHQGVRPIYTVYTNEDTNSTSVESSSSQQMAGTRARIHVDRELTQSFFARPPVHGTRRRAAAAGVALPRAHSAPAVVVGVGVDQQIMHQVTSRCQKNVSRYLFHFAIDQDKFAITGLGLLVDRFRSCRTSYRMQRRRSN